MNFTIDDRIKENPELIAPVARANKALEEMMGVPPLKVTGTWNLAQDDPQHPQIELKMSDSLASFSRRFTAEELANSDPWKPPLYPFWKDFLRVFSQKHLVRLAQLVDELDEE